MMDYKLYPNLPWGHAAEGPSLASLPEAPERLHSVDNPQVASMEWGPSGTRDSKMRVLVQATSFGALLWCINANDEN